DEAYVDFAEDHCLDFLERYPRVVIIRTMSKSYALAHARIGFACAHPFIIEGMIKVKDSYNVNGLSQMIALAALEDQGWLRNTVKEICQNREFLATALQSLGFKVIPSQTNFIFTQPPFNARRYYELLRTKKILIRYFPGPYTGDFVRITIGRQEEMKTLIQVTQEIIRNYQ
ncbi:MAG: aminotransferase class I/II-fold pyridoxal phosphate-dependent enzyme, partial [Candidatus Bathyarchaeia archaeon]